MHPLKPLLLVGISAAGASAENDSACGPVSTVFITVPASPTTETIYALSKASTATVEIEALVDGIAQVTSTAITTTVTTSVISTQIIGVIQASSPVEGQAAYPSTEKWYQENGTWLGATPPASASLITSTQVVTLQPVPPGYVAPQEGTTPVTSYLTLSSTETTSETPTETKTLTITIETPTETKTLTITTASASTGAYPGLAFNGWNSSMSTFVTVKSPTVGSVAIPEKAAYHPGTAYSMAPSGTVPYSPGNATRHIKARDVGYIVVATIDGAVVSWTNNYDGTSLSTSDTSPIIIPVTATALQSESEPSPTSSPLPSAVQTASNSHMGPKTTVGVYTPSTTSTSLSSTVQLTTSHAFSSPLYSNSSTASSTTTASSCGDTSAEFIIDFDDLPAFSAGPGNTDIPPIFNPYHKLFFQEYFGYVPPPSDPFPPISPPQLAVYRAGGSGAAGSPDADLELTGEIGSGPRASENAYWIDAYSAYLGCTNAGPDDCNIMVKGYLCAEDWSTHSVITQGFTQPPCPGMKNCSLTLVEFADGFRGLTGLQIIATVGTTPVDWYMDNLSLGWSNNTCAAQLERSSHQ